MRSVLKNNPDKIEGILPKVIEEFERQSDGRSEYYSYAPNLCTNPRTAYSYRLQIQIALCTRQSVLLCLFSIMEAK